MTQAEIYELILMHKNPEGVNLKGASLTGADLIDANLTGADLTRANLWRANLTGAYLTDANLTGADMRGAYLTDANLTGANLTGAYLTDADMRGAYLTDANLTGADMRGADLRGADMRGADLRGADMGGADLPLRVITLPRVGQIARTCWAWVMDDGVEITLGCRRFTSWDEARAHYTAPDYEGKCADRIDAALARLDYGQAMEAVVRAMEIASS